MDVRDIMLVLHFLGLALGVGNGFAHMFLGVATAKMSKEDAQSFAIKTFAVNKMGYIGLFLLVVSGGYLMSPYWDSLMSNHILLTKLVLVLILILLIVVMNGLAKKATAEGGGESLTKIKKLGMITLPLSVIIVVLAILTFH